MLRVRLLSSSCQELGNFLGSAAPLSWDDSEEPPSATFEPGVSTTDGAGGPGSASKGALDKDDADFVNLLTAPHASHEVGNAILNRTIGRG